jgi:hypothetical protein
LYLAVWTDVGSEDLEESLEERLMVVVLLGRQAEHRGRQLGRVTHHHQLTVLKGLGHEMNIFWTAYDFTGNYDRWSEKRQHITASS